MKKSVLSLCVDSDMLVNGIVKKYLNDFVKQIENSIEKTIILDMKRVNFVDSSGIVLIVKIYKLSKKLNRQFCLCNVNKEIKNLMRVVNLDKVIPMV